MNARTNRRLRKLINNFEKAVVAQTEEYTKPDADHKRAAGRYRKAQDALLDELLAGAEAREALDFRDNLSKTIGKGASGAVLEEEGRREEVRGEGPGEEVAFGPEV